MRDIIEFFESMNRIGTFDYPVGGKRRAVVFMPRWFYALALFSMLGFGLLIGWAL